MVSYNFKNDFRTFIAHKDLKHITNLDCEFVELVGSA